MKTKKHPNVNLENYSKLFTQLGLVLALVIVLTLIKSKTYANEILLFSDNGMVDENTTEENVTYKVEQPKPKKKPVQDLSELTKIDDDIPIEEMPIDVIDVDTPVPTIDEIDEFDEGPVFNPEDEVPFIAVEVAPVFPGCKGSEEEMKACFSKQIGKFIQKRFDTELAGNLGLSPGIKRIFVLFKIDRNGNITDIQSRAPHKRLELEAESIVEKLPQMTPGKQQGRAVPVKFSIPIAFKVE